MAAKNVTIKDGEYAKYIIDADDIEHFAIRFPDVELVIDGVTVAVIGRPNRILDCMTCLLHDFKIPETSIQIQPWGDDGAYYFGWWFDGSIDRR